MGDLGSGIQNAGNLFAQAIMGRHEEEERKRREALAQQNEMAEQQRYQRQLDIQEANGQYDRALRGLQTAPPGSSMTPETAMTLPAQLRETYTEHLPQGLAGVINQDGSAVPQKPERYDVRQPYRYQETVAETNAGAKRDIAGAQIASREEIARKAREQSKSYQDAILGLRGQGNQITLQRINAAIQIHNDMTKNRTDLNEFNAQQDWDLALAKAREKYPDYNMPTPRPKRGASTGAPTTGPSLDDVAGRIGALLTK